MRLIVFVWALLLPKERFILIRFHIKFLVVFDNLKSSTMGLKCLSNAMSSSILLVFKARYSFESNRSFLQSALLTIFNLLVHVGNVDVSMTTESCYSIAKSWNPFLYHPSMHCLCQSLRIRIFVANNCDTEILVGYVGVYVIIVHVFQVDTILFEKNQEICVVAYKMLWYLCICLTEIKAVACRPIEKYSLITYLLVACHIIKDKDGIRKHLVQWYDVTVIRVCKIINFFYL